MIVFSQDETPHSRLGNSLIWMTRAKPHLGGVCSVFPWAVENFGCYLEASSFWMRNSPIAAEFFGSFFGLEFSALNVSLAARMIEQNNEAAATRKLLDMTKLELSVVGGKVLYLAGQIDFFSKETLDAIKKHELTICHEPFGFMYKLQGADEVFDCKGCEPNRRLIIEQTKVVEKLSAGRKRIGLHIRRGDYRVWNNGDYNYDDELWLDLAKAEAEKGHAIFVFSNEVDLTLKDQLHNLGCFVLVNSFEIDFTQMMLMHHVYGPPSTFTKMANRIAQYVFGSGFTFERLPKRVGKLNPITLL